MKITDKDITNIMLDVPHAFEVDGEHFLFYPPSLGMVNINASIMQKIEVNDKLLAMNSIIEALRIVKTKRAEVCTLIAYNTFHQKKDVLDTHKIHKRRDWFMKHLTDSDIALLLIQIMQFVMVSRTQQCISHLHINEDESLQKRVMHAKVNNNTYVFGGKSLYGAMIGAACEKYGWTYDYVVWGISYTNLQLLMADATNSIYLTDEERKSNFLPSPSAKKIRVTEDNIAELSKRFT